MSWTEPLNQNRMHAGLICWAHSQENTLDHWHQRKISTGKRKKAKKRELELKKKGFFRHTVIHAAPGFSSMAKLQRVSRTELSSVNTGQNAAAPSSRRPWVKPRRISVSEPQRVHAEPPKWGLHQPFMQKQRKQDTTGLTSASSSSSSCNSPQTEFNQFFTAAN